MDTAHKISKNGAYNETFKKSSVKIPNLDPLRRTKKIY
jgi:hypothetical protein